MLWRAAFHIRGCDEPLRSANGKCAKLDENAEKNGYLEQVKRQVIRGEGKRPKGETGYQLVASKIVEELNNTLTQNTHRALAFNADEKSALVDLLASHEARELAAALASTGIREARNYDLCSMLSTILWVQASGSLKTTVIDSRYSSLVGKYVQHDPRLAQAMSEIAKRLSKSIGSSLSLHAEQRFTQKETLAAILLFAMKLHNFMAKCSPSFVEKLRWCFVPAQSLGYQFSKVSGELPSIVQDLTKLFKTKRDPK